jgi:hypothetical protein
MTGAEITRLMKTRCDGMNFKELRIDEMCDQKDKYKLTLQEKDGNGCSVWASREDLVNIHKLLTDHLKKSPEKTCDTCSHKPLAPFELSSFCFCCIDLNHWAAFAKEVKQESPVPPSYFCKSSMCEWHHDSIQRLGKLFDKLEKKVKALEDQHREIAKVPPIYPKPCYCKFPGQLPAVCLTFCASTECIYHKEHKG